MQVFCSRLSSCRVNVLTQYLSSQNACSLYITDGCKHRAKCNAGYGLNTEQIWGVWNWSHLSRESGANLEIYFLHAMHVSELLYCMYVYVIFPLAFHMFKKPPLNMRIANVKRSILRITWICGSVCWFFLEVRLHGKEFWLDSWVLSRNSLWTNSVMH